MKAGEELVSVSIIVTITNNEGKASQNEDLLFCLDMINTRKLEVISHGGS